MIPLYPVPQIMQLVATVPNALWGIERLNRGYGGPTVNVRRASDNAAADCRSQEEIATLCAGTNGFVQTAYDQSGNGRDQSNATLAAQPKVYDSATGIVRSGATPLMQFDGVDDVLGRIDQCGINSVASPGLTTALMLGAWTNTGVTAWSLGPDNPGPPNSWYQGHSASTTTFLSFRTGSRSFTCSDPSLARGYFVARKALNADASTIDLRQNKSTLTQTATVAGPMALEAGGATRVAAAVTAAQWAACTIGMLGHWQAQLSGAELDALEQVLERMRLQ